MAAESRSEGALTRSSRCGAIVEASLKVLSGEGEIDSRVAEVLRLLSEGYGFSDLGVRLLDARGHLPITHRLGLDIDYADATTIVPTRETMYGRAFLDGEPVVVANTDEVVDSTYFELLHSIIPVTALLHMPMVVSGKPIGVLMAYSTSGPFDFSAEVIEVFGVVANALALAVTVSGLTGQLAGLSHSVEERVRSRTAQLEAANERLHELDRVKSEFLSNVSHELRTPLTSIQSFSEILLEYEPAAPEKRKEFAKVIHGEAVRLKRMIDDLLDLSRNDAGRLHVELSPVDLEFTSRKAVESTAPLFAANRVHVTTEIEARMPPVRADADRLLQVFHNLLGNAAKFAPVGSIVRVRARRRGSFAVVSVADRGQGIDPAKFKDVFDRYLQLRDPGERRSLGTGLGLAISRELVERFGGYIWVESVRRAGSTFYFTIPFA